MNKHIFLLAVLMAVLLPLSSCGGGSSGTSTGSSPFAGSWTGLWSSPQGQSGTVSVTISADGAANGTIYDSTTGQNGSVSGTVSNSGNISVTYIYPTATYTANGTIGINSSGQLLGSANEYSGTTLFGTVTYDLINTSSVTGSSPFVGNWTGAFTGTNHTVTLSITIFGNGTATGSIYNTHDDVPGVVSGTIDNIGNMNFIFYYQSGGVISPAPGPGDYTEIGTVSINSSGQLVGSYTEYDDTGRPGIQGSFVATGTIDLIKQ